MHFAIKISSLSLSYFQNSFTITYVYLAIEMAILYRLPYHLYEIETLFAIKISSLSLSYFQNSFTIKPMFIWLSICV